jgi:chromosome segregation ATPase|nr:MAG TPA: C4H2 Zinc finger-containing protein [Caudoviricetes sp.]
MSINIKKYTKDQMAKMVEDAQEKSAAFEAEVVELKNCIDEKNDLIAEYANLKAEMQRKNAALTERIDQMNGEAITRENVIANLKADADALRNKLDAAEAALGRANAEVSRMTVGCRQVEEERDYMHQQWSNAEQRANYAEAHPWRNLWAWVKRKLGGERNEHVS